METFVIIIIIIIIMSFRFLIASQVRKGFIYRTLKVAQLEISSKFGSSPGGLRCNYATTYIKFPEPVLVRIYEVTYFNILLFTVF
jgi:hypothetical protein